jgi:hypothetical protein
MKKLSGIGQLPREETLFGITSVSLCEPKGKKKGIHKGSD